jgi:dTDP-glucose 4,6-dehydratase
MKLKGKKILVTGADGFIGSHLVEELLSRGLDVRAFVYYNSFGSWGWLDTLPEKVKKDLDVVMGDIRDPFGVRDAMVGCDVVFHLAALIAIPYSYRSPDTYIDTNIKGTLNVVQAARDLNVERVIQTSTSEVYGTALYAPINEEHPLQGQSPYSASKIGSDQIALSYHRSFSTPVSVVRPFNTYGPRQSLRAVIPTIILQTLSGKEKIKLGNLQATRDFSFVEDTARGFIMLAECDACVGEVTNIGSGFEISIKDTVQLISEAAGLNLQINIETDRLRPEASEVYRLIADVSKAEKLFNWKAEFNGVSGFKKGIKRTIDWFKEPDNINKYPQIDKYII